LRNVTLYLGVVRHEANSGKTSAPVTAIRLISLAQPLRKPFSPERAANMVGLCPVRVVGKKVRMKREYIWNVNGAVI